MKTPLRALAVASSAAMIAGLIAPTAANAAAAGVPKHATNAQRTAALVLKILDDAPTLAGADRHNTAPDPRLRGAGTGGGAHVIDRHSWWTTDRSPAQVRHAFHRKLVAHPRLAGLVFRNSFGFGSSGGVRGDGYTAHRLSYAYDIDFEVTTVAVNGGTAYRLDAQAAWAWPKNKYDHITAPTRAIVVVNKPHSGYAFVVGAHKAMRLAGIVNHLPTYPAGAIPCPLQRPHDNDVLRFRTPKGTVVVRVQATGCEKVTIRVGSHHGRALQDADGRLNRVVRHLAG